MKNTFYVLFLTLVVSCNQDFSPTPQVDRDYEWPNQYETGDSNLLDSMLIWRAPYGDSTQSSFGAWPLLTESFFIYNDAWEGPNGSDIIYALDKETGELVWKFSSPLLDRRNDNSFGAQSKGDLLLFANGNSVYCVSKSGNLIWHQDIEDYGNITGNLIGDYYYYNATYGKSRVYPDSAAIIRFNIHSGKSEKVCTVKRKEGYTPNAYGTSLWVKPNGDSLLIFQNRQLSHINSDVRVDLLAFNLRSDSIEWINWNITWSGNSGISVPPTVKNDYIYFQGANSIIKVKPSDGSIVWTFKIEESGTGGFFESNLIIEEGLVIANPVSAKLFAIDDQTGELVWERGEIASFEEPNLSTYQNMVYHEGNIYFGAGFYFICMRIEDGKTLWKEESPFKHDQPNLTHSFSGSGIAFDSKNEVLYINDRVWIMALQL